MREAVIHILTNEGPMSISDIAESLGWIRDRVAKVVLSTRHEHKGKWFRIVGYHWQDNKQGREIPVYAAGGGEDRPRPQATKARHNAQKRAHYRRHSARINAKAKIKRDGGVTENNPWLQLASRDVRPFMSRETRKSA